MVKLNFVKHLVPEILIDISRATTGNNPLAHTGCALAYIKIAYIPHTKSQIAYTKIIPLLLHLELIKINLKTFTLLYMVVMIKRNELQISCFICKKTYIIME